MLNWLIRKKRRKDDESRWMIAEGEDAGFPLIYRIRTTFPPGIDTSKYPTLLAIHWDIQTLTDRRMPSPKEQARMEQLEDLLTEGLGSIGQSYLTAVVTGNGVREWQWYTRDPQEALSRINATLSGKEPFPIKIIADEDTEWSAYHDMVSLLQ